MRSNSNHDFVDRVRIYHQPGAGGTTSAMHILWTLREEYRVCMVPNCSDLLSSEQIDKVVTQIMDFRNYKEPEHTKAKPVLVLLDSPDEETEFQLLSETNNRAKSMDRPGDQNWVFCVFLECLHLTSHNTFIPHSSNDLSYVLLKHELSLSERSWFKDKGRALQNEFDASMANSVNPDSLISFNILKSNFSKEFISNTVGALVKAITREEERTLLKYITLLNSFDSRAVPLAAFDEMMKVYHVDQKKRMIYRQWENELSDEFRILVVNKKTTHGTQGLCSNNALLAKASLEALCNASDGRDTVSNAALEFFRCSVFHGVWQPRQSVENLLRIVKDVLKKRQHLPSSVYFDFPPMVLHISQTESSERACAVLEEGYKLTRDPFVAQQLARLWYIKLRDWNQASMAINSAINQLPKNSFLWDTYGRIFEKRLSSEYEKYKDGVETLTRDKLVEIIEPECQ